MPDTFAITILFIAVSTVLAAFLRGRSRDKCLMDFSGNRVNIVAGDGKSISGILSVESTGIELKYLRPDEKDGGFNETSCLIYKNEYGGIQTIIRYHDELMEKNRKKRDRELRKTYHPNLFRRMTRKTHNFFSTVKDSITEVLTMFLGQAGKMSRFGSVLSSQDKYVSQMKQGVIGTIAHSFEPLLEKHIGRKVVAELSLNSAIIKYTGILKDYTSAFVEIMDVISKKTDGGNARTADLLLPRSISTVRHLGE